MQHIFNGMYTTTGGQHGWLFSFTQEWPVFSLEHQLSYTIPSSHLTDGTDRVYGIGDILINYRYQALEEGETKPAFAPRFSLILPTGNRDRGTGNGVVGYQWSLPFSKKMASRFAMHANFGLTYLPHVHISCSSGLATSTRALTTSEGARVHSYRRFRLVFESPWLTKKNCRLLPASQRPLDSIDRRIISARFSTFPSNMTSYRNEAPRQLRLAGFQKVL